MPLWRNSAQRRFSYVIRLAFLWKVAAIGVLLYFLLSWSGVTR